MRRRPSTTRRSITHRFEINAGESPVKGYITVGLFDDGNPAEVFIVLAMTGEAIRGMARCFATCFSLCLQYGVPLETLTDKFRYFRFEPSGWTDNPEIQYAQSIADYVCHWLDNTFRNARKPARITGLSGQ